jgi:hypothetical protein
MGLRGELFNRSGAVRHSYDFASLCCEATKTVPVMG